MIATTRDHLQNATQIFNDSYVSISKQASEVADAPGMGLASEGDHSVVDNADDEESVHAQTNGVSPDSAGRTISYGVGRSSPSSKHASNSEVCALQSECVRMQAFGKALCCSVGGVWSRWRAIWRGRANTVRNFHTQHQALCECCWVICVVP